MIQREQSALIRPISIVLGYVMDFFFNSTVFFTVANSLGISIILLTIVTRLLMLPLSFNSQKSMSAMKKVQPEMEAIKKKYGDSTDPEVKQKMNREIQALYSKHKVNPFGGCLPMLIQMPIFFALNYMMQHTYMFIKSLGEIYYELADLLLRIPNRFNYLLPLVQPKVPNNIMADGFDISQADDLVRALNRFSQQDWQDLLYKTPQELGIDRFPLPPGETEWLSYLVSIPQEFVYEISMLLAEKQSIEFFFGINLKDISGWAFPGILIPILTTATMFLSSWLMTKQQPPAEGQAKMTQQLMTYGLPVFFGFTTASFAAGVGVYWVVSTIFQIFQQMYLVKYFEKKEGKKEAIIEDKKAGEIKMIEDKAVDDKRGARNRKQKKE